jgi:hypothetical protein
LTITSKSSDAQDLAMFGDMTEAARNGLMNTTGFGKANTGD